MLDWSILCFNGSVAVDYGLSNYEVCSHRLDAVFAEVFLRSKMAISFLISQGNIFCGAHWKHPYEMLQMSTLNMYSHRNAKNKEYECLST